jgi:hypothetical protein
MFSDLEFHVTASVLLLTTLGVGYLIDRSYSKPDLKQPDSPLYGFHSQEDLPPGVDAIPELDEDAPVPEPVDEPLATEELEQPEPSHSTDISEAVSSYGHGGYSTDYRNVLWPSPRPVNFVKALVKSDHVQIEGRLTHGKAIEILSSRAHMQPEEFLSVDPITYSRKFMPHQYNAAVLLGQSIQRLEDYIRRQQYLATLRKHG